MVKLIIILGVLLFPITAAADSDEAILNLTGNVPARVDIALDDGDLDFGELLGEVESTVSTNVITRSNVPFNLTVRSENDGRLVWDGVGESAEDLRIDYDYTFTFGDTDITLEGETSLISGGSRGREVTTIEITTEDIESLLSNTESEMPTEGTYEDELTFTITAGD